MTYKFKWTALRMGMIVTIQVTDTTILEAMRRIADAYAMTLPTFRRFLQREGYELSVMEVRKK